MLIIVWLTAQLGQKYYQRGHQWSSLVAISEFWMSFTETFVKGLKYTKMSKLQCWRVLKSSQPQGLKTWWTQLARLQKYWPLTSRSVWACSLLRISCCQKNSVSDKGVNAMRAWSRPHVINCIVMFNLFKINKKLRQHWNNIWQMTWTTELIFFIYS